MRVNTSNTQKFKLQNTEIEEVESFVCLGGVVSENGGTEEDVASRINTLRTGIFSSIFITDH
jgi:hypothetical protein